MLFCLWKAKGGNVDFIGDFDQSVYFDNDNDLIAQYALYLFNGESKKCEQIVRDNGFLLVTPQTAAASSYLFKDSGCSVNLRQKTSWKKILGNGKDFSCNALVIIDKYLSNFARENLFPILETLLPRKRTSEYPFYISIFTRFNNRSSGQEFYDSVDDCVREILTDNDKLAYEYCITLYDCVNNAFHNRVIISNNFYIACPAGFDLLNEKYQAIKESNINIIFPTFTLSIDWARQDMDYNLKIARKIYNETKGFRSYTIPQNAEDNNPLLLLPPKNK